MLNKFFSRIALWTLAGILAVSCDEKAPQKVDEPMVSIELTDGSVTHSTAAFAILSSDCERVAWLIAESRIESADASVVFSDGQVVDAIPDDGKVAVELSDLKEQTSYYVYAAGMTGEYTAVAGPIEFVTLEAPVELPDEINVSFTSAANVSQEDGKFILEFGSEGVYSMSAELISSEFAGTYVLGESLVKETTELVISGHEIPELDGTYSFASGQLEISGDIESWTILGALVTDGGMTVNVSYDGAVDGIETAEEFDYEVEFTSATQYLFDPGSIYIEMSDAVEGYYQFNLWCWVKEYEQSIPTGELVAAEEGTTEPGTFVPSDWSIWISDVPDYIGKQFRFIDGSASVVKDKIHYKFDITGTLEDGKTVHIVYDGVVNGLPDIVVDEFDYDVEFDTASNASQADPNNFYVTFGTSDQVYELYLDIYGVDGVLETGNYYSGAGSSWVFSTSYTKVKIDGIVNNSKRGEVHVTNNGDGTYEFETLLELADGKYFRGTYSGTI